MNKETSVLITGISHGIGHSLAAEYARLGFNVIGCARSKAKPPLPTIRCFEIDVSDHYAVNAWADALRHEHIVPDIIINNAAIANKPAPLWEIPQQDFDQLIDINIKGVANILRAFLPQLFCKQRGIIVNMSSGWGRYGSANVSSYCASKFAVEGLTQSLAEELPFGIIAVTLSPGIVKTDMLLNCSPSSYNQAVTPDVFAKKAVPFINSLTSTDNGSSLSC